MPERDEVIDREGRPEALPLRAVAGVQRGERGLARDPPQRGERRGVRSDDDQRVDALGEKSLAASVTDAGSAASA